MKVMDFFPTKKHHSEQDNPWTIDRRRCFWQSGLSEMWDASKAVDGILPIVHWEEKQTILLVPGSSEAAPVPKRKTTQSKPCKNN